MPSSVLSYYEAKVPGLRAVADHRGGRAYRRGDAMVLAGMAAEVADGSSLTDVLSRIETAGRDSVMLRGRRLVDHEFPGEANANGAQPVRAVPEDAIVMARGARTEAEPSRPRAPANREAILRALADCVQHLQRAR